MSHFSYFFAHSEQLIRQLRTVSTTPDLVPAADIGGTIANPCCFAILPTSSYSHQDFALHILPKQTLDHIVLTPYSKIKVKLAAQVFSKSVMIALQESGKEVLETARFCGMIKDFFDYTNVWSLTEHIRKRNPLMKSYTSADDERLSWLLNVFLSRWRNSIATQPDEVVADQRGKIFLSQLTYEGFTISVYSGIKVIPFLLGERIPLCLV